MLQTRISVIDCITVVILCALGFFAAAWRIEYPGLYYDEALFVPPSALIFDDCKLSVGVYFQIGCVPLIIQPPYLGGLKSIIFAPIFAIFDVSMYSIRLPAIFILIITNLAVWLFWRTRLPFGGAMMLLLMLSVDFVSLFHAKVDWGPFVIANFLKIISIMTAINFIEKNKFEYLLLSILSIFIGVWDKLNFLWVLAALTIAIFCIYTTEMVYNFKSRSFLSFFILITSLIIGCFWFYYSILPIARQSTGGSFDIVEQFNRMRAVIPNTLNAGAYPLLMGGTWPGTRYISYIASGATIIGLVAGLIGPYLNRKLIISPDIIRIARYSAFFAVMNIIFIGCLVVTREAGGPHHVVILSHVWQIQLICTIVLLIMIANKLPFLLKRSCHALLFSIIAFTTLLNVDGLRHHWAAQHSTHAFSTRFTPAIVDLGIVLGRQGPGPFVSVDWGIHNSILSLAPRGTRDRFVDSWPTFKDVGEGRIPPSQGALALGAAPVFHLIYRPREGAVFPGTVDGLEKLFPIRPGCEELPTEVRDSAGRLQFLILKRSRDCLP